MKAAIIGASSESLHAIKKAKELGVVTVALDGNPEAEGLAAADFGLHIDISDEEAVIAALREEQPDFVLPVPIGRYLTTIGAVNDALGLPGVTKRAAELCTDKYKFHQILRNRNLRDCHCYLINKEYLQIPPVGFPAILKPRYGSGSRAVYYVESKQELEEIMCSLFDLPEGYYNGNPSGVKNFGQTTSTASVQRYINPNSVVGASMKKQEEQAKVATLSVSQFLEQRRNKKYQTATANMELGQNVQNFQDKIKEAMEPETKQIEKAGDEDYILEEAFEGEEYGVDGVLESYNFELVLLRRKINTPLPERQAVGYISVVPDWEHRVYGLIKEHLGKVLQTMGLKDCLIHADVLMRGRNIFVIELSARPSGHNLHNLFTPMATGIDVCEQYMQYMSGEPHNFQPIQTRKMMIHYFDMENCFVHKIPDPEQLELPERVKLRDWKCNIRMLDFLGKVTDGHSLMGRGYFILEGPDDQRLIEAAEMVKNQFELM